MSSLNTIRAILLLNAKRGPKKGSSKAKGWTDEARAKAALTRKRKAKVAAKTGAKRLKKKESLDDRYFRGQKLIVKQRSKLEGYKGDKATKLQGMIDRNSKRLDRIAKAIKNQPLPKSSPKAKVVKVVKAPAVKKVKGISVGGGGALKTRNELTKYFGLKKAWNGDSNPYSDTQSLAGTLHPKKSQALLKHLDSPDSGWTKDNSSVLPGNNLYKKGQDVIVVGKPYKAMNNKDYVHVSIHGPKKKKPYTIPYYD